MVTKIFLKPHLVALTLPSKFVFPHTNKPSLTLTLSLPTTLLIPHFSTTPLSYGPSLHKGATPFPSQSQSQSPSPLNQNDAVLREEAFTRVFHLAALRVPSAECSALERRLRGHLLNWPRVRNIARVPGDDVHPDLAPLLSQPIHGNGNGEEEKTIVSLQRRIHGRADGDGDVLSPVLYRERLARTFNSRGFVKFRNLAKVSRPNRNKKRRKRKEEGDGVKRVGENGFAAVEVVEEDEEEGGGLRNLVGEEFVARSKWRGSTRLLLLDERHAACGVEELPEAIKAVLKEYAEKSTTLTLELVRCKLTLFYDYWQMTEVLETLLPEGMIIPSAFETVGHIAHLNLRDEHLPYKRLIAKVVLDKNKPRIQTVVNKIDSIQNEYRTMQLEVLAGNHSLVTTVVENGIRFQVDLATVYWSSRLGTERQRLLSGLTRNDVVCMCLPSQKKPTFVILRLYFPFLLIIVFLIMEFSWSEQSDGKYQ
ncbi:tRNA (guanine(37)-N1)-methyltransferase 1 [Spatholobus suberectus]|nr:tRNA (guanine(37)-N1)-methyltransferase 1 [Spatholobus suberectus]